jgi:long-subunit fatty acid transport protein
LGKDRGIGSGDLKNQFSDNFYPKYSNYNVSTPTKAILSGSYFFASPSKPTQPLGFISADVEFVNYAGTKYYTLDNDQSVVNYYQDLNTTIKNNYKNAINFKVGSELKLSNAWLARAGAAYYGSPYKDNGISASHMSISGGLGYRMGNQFVDFTIVNIASKYAVFPYRLIDKDNYYAEQKNNRFN